MSERNVLLDVLKGFAIFLVVMGHAIQYNQVDFDTNPVFRFIYSFHMPLFMFVSGFILKKIIYRSPKATRLLFNKKI